MSATTKARTARIAHRCNDCRRTTIAPGHRYLLHTVFPGDINSSGRPWALKQCVACLSDRDPAGPLLAAGACSTFCCALTPCARPLGHDDDHQCGACLADTTPARPHHDVPALARPVTTVHLPAADIA